jgi:hypothetical protein
MITFIKYISLQMVLLISTIDAFSLMVFFSTEMSRNVVVCTAEHAALMRKSKDWFARNQNNVSEWSDLSTHGLLFQYVSSMKIQLNVLV